MCRDKEQERGVWTECDLCGGEIRRGDRYYRVAGENVCRKCLDRKSTRLNSSHIL